LSSRYRSGVDQGLAEPPWSFRMPIAGSASVAVTPSTRAKTAMTTGPTRPGSLMPQRSPSGITPRKSPSRKKARPAIVAAIPTTTDRGSRIG